MGLTKKEKLYSASVGFVLGAIYVVVGILESTNSTASIGVLFIPFYGGFGAVLSLAAYYAIKTNWLTRIALVLVSAVLGFGFYEKSENLKSASDSNTPASYLADLAQAKMLFGREEVLEAIAQNPNVTPELLLTLSKKEFTSVRMKVAENPAAPAELLNQMAQQGFNHDLHSALARNPKLPSEIIDKLLTATAQDFPGHTEFKLYQTFVWGPLARHANLTDAQFTKLTQFENPEYFLIYGIIESGRASCELLKKFRDGDNGALKSNATHKMRQQECGE